MLSSASVRSSGVRHHILITSPPKVRRELPHLSGRTGIPVIYGVITTDTIEQALERAGIKAGNKGSEAATAGIETVNLYKTIEKVIT